MIRTMEFHVIGWFVEAKCVAAGVLDDLERCKVTVLIVSVTFLSVTIKLHLYLPDVT